MALPKLKEKEERKEPEEWEQGRRQGEQGGKHSYVPKTEYEIYEICQFSINVSFFGK